jgi:hypothetical protein
MVDDTDDRKQPAVGRSPKLLFGQSVRRSHDVAALRAQEVAKELALVRRRKGRARIRESHAAR